MSGYHIPVLLHQSVELLGLQAGGVYVDVTFGGGGHTGEILRRLAGQGRVVAFDKDPDARMNIPDDPGLVFVPADFKFIETALEARSIGPVDGILADLGVSSHQFDTAERGFSFRFDGPLDMRMDPSQGESAASLLATAPPESLVRIFRTYGEVPNAPRLATVLVQARTRQAIQTTRDLEFAIRSCLPPRGQAQYLAQVYQALRIVVNGELEALEALLMASLRVLKPGGRLVVISYHSLEDRMVKRFMRSGNLAGIEEKDFYGHSLSPWEQVTRKAIQPDAAEIAANPRARSARLRAVARRVTTT
ncbi:MAG: 16S rRNA (cytosine(1402)-N(4))-methyltransferase RsmH [Bacteroidia bacterium]|nr:16S rRNA (cytosine(1402)-N(4))-methyltransferase RsmH [Bacteroidia bacterium]